jgi:hypothetical protein
MITGMHGKVMPCNRIPKKMLWCEYVIEAVDVVLCKNNLMARDPHETS